MVRPLAPHGLATAAPSRRAPAQSSDALSEGALRWIGSNLECFDPIPAEGERNDPQTYKAFIELALLVWRLRREPRTAGKPELERLLQFVAEIFAFDPFRERLIRLDDLFVTYVLLYGALREAGRIDDDREQQRLQRFVDGSTVQVAERPAHRVLEVRHVLDVAGLRHDLPSFKALAARTILARPIGLVRSTEQDAYAITHDLFYLSDWGCSPVRGLSETMLARTRRTVEDMLGMYVYARQLDLVGELLLATQFLDDTATDFYRCGWDALHDAQVADGSVPGPGFDPEEAEVRAEEERRDYVFEECYHPTLVAALAGALCSPPDRGADA